MVTLAFVLAVRCGVKFVDVNAQISSAKSLLSSFGVKGPFRLQQLNLPPNGAMAEGDVVLTDGQRNTYTARFSAATGTIYTLCLGSWPNMSHGFNSHPIQDPRIEKKVQSWARRLCRNEEIRLDNLSADGNGHGEAVFSILKNGYPIIGANACNCVVEFTLPDGRFISFVVRNDPPPVDSRPPVLKEADAIKTFQRVYTFDIATRALEEHGWKLTYKLMSAPTIGYYLLEGQRVAHLVWRVPYMGYRNVGYAVQGGSNAMLIDAIDGKVIPTKTVP